MKQIVVMIVAFIALTACSPEVGADSQAPTSESTPTQSTSGTPGTDSIPAELVGTWASKDGDLVLRLNADGTFEEDLNGTRAAYKGSYVVRETSFHLTADSGAEAEGTIVGDFDHLELSGYELWR